MKSQRFLFLDFIKAVSILLVVFCHYVVIPPDSYIGNAVMILAWAAVPCFLMCSGYVFCFKEEPLQKWIERIANIYFVMLIWKILYLFFFINFSEISFGKVSLLQYLFLFEPLEGVNIGHFWFLYAYICCLLLCPILVPLFKANHHKTILFILILCYAPNQFVYSIQFILNLCTNAIGCNAIKTSSLANLSPFSGMYSYVFPFFIIGGLFRLCDHNGIGRSKKILIAGAVCFATGFASLSAIKYTQCGTWLWGGKYLDAGYQWTGTILMTVGMFILLKAIGEQKFPIWLGKYVGKCTMGIFYLHVPLLYWACLYILPKFPQATWVNFGKTFVVALISTAISLILKKVPFVRRIVT